MHDSWYAKPAIARKARSKKFQKLENLSYAYISCEYVLYHTVQNCITAIAFDCLLHPILFSASIQRHRWHARHGASLLSLL